MWTREVKKIETSREKSILYLKQRECSLIKDATISIIIHRDLFSKQKIRK